VKKLVQLSVRYVYEEARKLDTFKSDEGTSIRSAMKVLNKQGVPPQSCWKYKVHQTDKPCPTPTSSPNRTALANTPTSRPRTR